MKIIKSLCAFLFTILLADSLFTGCSSNRAKYLVESGNDVEAVEYIAPRLAKKPADEELVELFTAVYPSAIERRLPRSSISYIISENLDVYSYNQITALKKCASELSGDTPLTRHKAVAAIIKESDEVLSNLTDIIRIQSAVNPVPYTIGSEKNNNVTQIVKYTDDFSQIYQSNRAAYGEFYYNLAEALIPGKSLTQKLEIYNYYQKANLLVPGIDDVNNRAANICYKIAEEYEAKSDLKNKQEAVNWFNAALKWVPNYSDAQTRIYKISYDIAMQYKKTAKTESDYEVVLHYLKLAGNYKDAEAQMKEITYQLAYIYKDKQTASSYDKAGQLFTSLGDYRNSKNETELYNFYKKMRSLSRTDKSGKVSLKTGKPVNQIDKKLEIINDTSAYSNVNWNSSEINVFTTVKDSTIVPGAIFEGQNIANLKFSPLTDGKRNSVEVSIANSGNELTTTIITPETKTAFSSITSSASRVERKMIPETTYRFIPVYSKDDLMASLGAGYGKSKIPSSFGSAFWDDNILLVEVTQKYYTASIADLKFPVDLFNSNSGVIKAGDIKSVTPYYVSSVDFGRKAYFIITSELPVDELISDISQYRPKDSTNKGGSTGTSISPMVVSKWSRAHSTINSINVGENTYLLNDLESMYSWIKMGVDKNLSVSNLVPVSFTLKNLYSNETAVLNLSDKLKVKYISKTQKEPDPAPTTQGGSTSSGNGTSGTSSTGTSDSDNGNATSKGDGSSNGDGTSNSGSTSTGNGTSGQTPSSNQNQTVGNDYTSLVFVGPSGNIYQCKSVSGITYTYEIPASEIEKCVAFWDSSKIKAVTINGVNMVKNSTVYSFRDVAGNTISLDITDANSVWTHNLLIVKKIY